MAILDNSLANIPTAGIGNTLLFASIDSTAALPSTALNLAAGSGSYAGLQASIPEPGTLFALAGGLGPMLWLRRRRR